MTEDTETQLLDMTRQLVGQANSMHNELRDLTAEVRASRRSMDAQLGLISDQLSAFGGYQTTRDQDIADLRTRVERIERRLDVLPGDGR